MSPPREDGPSALAFSAVVGNSNYAFEGSQANWNWTESIGVIELIVHANAPWDSLYEGRILMKADERRKLSSEAISY